MLFGVTLLGRPDVSVSKTAIYELCRVSKIDVAGLWDIWVLKGSHALVCWPLPWLVLNDCGGWDGDLEMFGNGKVDVGGPLVWWLV